MLQGKDGMDREHTYPSVRVTFSKLNKKDRKVHFAKEGTETSMFSVSGTDSTYLSTSQVYVLCMNGYVTNNYVAVGGAPDKLNFWEMKIENQIYIGID